VNIIDVTIAKSYVDHRFLVTEAHDRPLDVTGGAGFANPPHHGLHCIPNRIGFRRIGLHLVVPSEGPAPAVWQTLFAPLLLPSALLVETPVRFALSHVGHDPRPHRGATYAEGTTGLRR